MKNHININLTGEELKDIFSAHLVQPYNKLVAEVVVEALSKTDMGLYHLVRALLGKSYIPKYKVLDKVLVKADQLATWRYNTDEMRKQDLIVKDYVEAQITSIDIYKKTMYEIRYTCIMNNSPEFAEDSYQVAEDYIIDIPHELPELSEPDNDTIPF